MCSKEQVWLRVLIGDVEKKKRGVQETDRPEKLQDTSGLEEALRKLQEAGALLKTSLRFLISGERSEDHQGY